MTTPEEYYIDVRALLSSQMKKTLITYMLFSGNFKCLLAIDLMFMFTPTN